MKTAQLIEYRVSTFLNVKGDFTNLSDNLEVVGNTITVEDNKLEVVHLETDLSQENLELFINIPVMAADEEEAEEVAQAIIDKAENITIYLLDLDNAGAYSLKIEKPQMFAKAEYHIY